MRGVPVARGDEEARGSGTHPERGRPLGQGPRRGAARSRDLARRWGQRCLGVRSRSGPGLAAVACRGRTCESRVEGGGDGKSGRPRAGRLAPGASKMEGPAVRGPRRRARCAAPRRGAGRAVGSGPGKGGERGPEPGSRRSEGDAKNLAWGQSGLRYVFWLASSCLRPRVVRDLFSSPILCGCVIIFPSVNIPVCSFLLLLKSVWVISGAWLPLLTLGPRTFSRATSTAHVHPFLLLIRPGVELLGRL